MRSEASPRELSHAVLSERTERGLRAGDRASTHLRRPGVRAVSLARFAIFVTVAGWIAFTVTTLGKAFFGGTPSVRYAVDAMLYIGVTTLLTASALAYLLARLGALYRTRRHHRAGRVEIDRSFDAGAPTLTVLVPSYCEETDVIRQTLLTTALQEYPDLRIVLLIDDPPHPSDAHRLELGGNLQLLFEVHRAAGRLLAVAQGRVENQDRVGHVSHSGRPASGAVVFVCPFCRAAMNPLGGGAGLCGPRGNDAPKGA